MSQTLGIDFAWGKPDPAAVKAAGYTFVIGYISRDPTKDLTRDQALAYQAQGLGVLLVWEWTSGRALAGADAGIADAKEAVGKAQGRGYPDDVPILFADDTDSTAAQVRPYFAAISSVRPCSGAYGPYKVVDPLLADGTVRFGWQACAWATRDADGREIISQRAHLYQRLRPTTALQGSFDEDVLLKPLPMWTSTAQPLPVQPAPTPIPVPIPAQPNPRTGGTGVYIFRVSDGPNLGFEIYDYGYGPVHINGPESAELIAGGVKVLGISSATFTARFPALAS